MKRIPQTFIALCFYTASSHWITSNTMASLLNKQSRTLSVWLCRYQKACKLELCSIHLLILKKEFHPSNSIICNHYHYMGTFLINTNALHSDPKILFWPGHPLFLFVWGIISDTNKQPCLTISKAIQVNLKTQEKARGCEVAEDKRSNLYNRVREAWGVKTKS